MQQPQQVQQIYKPNIDRIRWSLHDEKEWKEQREMFIQSLFLEAPKSASPQQKRTARRIPRELAKKHCMLDIQTYGMTIHKSWFEQLVDTYGYPDDITALPEYIITAVRNQFKD